MLYRHPAYLLTTDLHSSAQQLLQIYFDRWLRPGVPLAIEPGMLNSISART